MTRSSLAPHLTVVAALEQCAFPDGSRVVKASPLLLAPVLFALVPLAACSHPVKEGATLGENAELLGPNITEEIMAGQFFIGQGDEITVDVWDHPDLSRTYTVDSDGTVFCHLVGKVDAYGLTRSQLRDRLTSAYGAMLVDPSVDVGVKIGLTRKVTVLGSVKNAGVFPMTEPRTSVLDVIALAGGITNDGDTTGVVVARRIDGQMQVNSYSLDMLFDPRDPTARTELPFIQPGDYVYVLRSNRAEFATWISIIRDTFRAITLAERSILLIDDVADEINN